MGTEAERPRDKGFPRHFVQVTTNKAMDAEGSFRLPILTRRVL